MEMGGKARPFPPLPIGAIIHIILANQKTSHIFTSLMDVTAYGHPTIHQLPIQGLDWFVWLVLQASELAKLCEKEWKGPENNLALIEMKEIMKLWAKEFERQVGCFWQIQLGTVAEGTMEKGEKMG